MKKYLIVSLLTVFLFSLSLFSNDSNEVQAATIGDQLIQPEAGWKRYDDKHTDIKLTGTWTNEPSKYAYKSGRIWSATIGSKIEFDFKGNMLRLIAFTHETAYSSEIKITIDGEVSSFSEKNKEKEQAIVFEKLGMENKRHSVVIEATNKAPFVGLDAIDINEDGYLIPVGLKSPILEGTVTDEGHSLTWNSIQGVTGYNVKRSLSAGGPYEVIASNVTTNSYLDKDIEKGKKYFYVITAVVNSIESENSNEVSLPIVENSNATLVLHLVNNQIKEYNLTSSELNNFLNWFTSGSESFYVFTIKSPEPPYNSIKDYIIKDKIVWFQVKEF